ncbi:uncharacterized protein LOC134816868 [Bolinopsis microptera]|uniref:uncharacterized protein LOC134816868 n=1 Tax=Bolinopsis microptera TaxID=2820187 RepID=UPI00307ABEF0
MGQKRKKTNIIDSTEIKNASKNFVRGEGPDLKSIQDKKLKRELIVREKHNAQAIRSAAFNQLLLPEERGCLEADEGERTLKFKQTEIVKHVDVGSARKHFSLALPHHGPYHCAYSRNGSKLLIGGAKGHVATFDWQTGKLGCEFHVKETIKDIAWLHNRDYIAVAQKKYAYIYDGSGTELHRLKNHINPVHLEYLPYHWLLVSTGATGYIKYHDVSIGKLIVELKTRLGQPHSMSHNPSNAIVNLGHSNGTVTMWSPSMKEPLVKMLCHHGPVTALAVDNSGRHMVTCGLDKQMKVWDARTYKESLSYYSHRPGSNLAISQTGLVAVSFGGQVQVWKDAFKTKQKAPYMTHLVEGAVIEGLDFANFEDVLGLGHSKGFTSLLIPGAGEANYDALELNPFESKRQKQENEVKMLLNKIQPELITLDQGSIHRMKVEDLEKPLDSLDHKELVLKFKMKGKNSAKRRFHRREIHIHDEKRVKVRAALEKVKNEKEGIVEEPRTILDRFKYKEA